MLSTRDLLGCHGVFAGRVDITAAMDNAYNTIIYNCRETNNQDLPA